MKKPNPISDRALFYEKESEDKVRCTLCPRYCLIPLGGKGFCKTRYNHEGELVLLNKDRYCGLHYDPIEKKPLYHLSPNNIIFSIGSFGCNFNCEFCQNHQIVSYPKYSGTFTQEFILEKAVANGSIGLAYTYNEPTVWYEGMLSLAQQLKKRNEGYKNVVVTNGSINEEPLLRLLPYVDGMNIDLKSIREDFYQKYCDGHLQPVLKTIALAAQKTHVEITTLLIEPLNTSPEEIKNIATTIAEIDDGIPLHLSRYFPCHRMYLPPTAIQTMVQTKEIAKRYLKYVYIGNVPGYR